MREAGDVIEIRGPEVSQDEIIAQIQARIQDRRTLAQAKGLDYDQLAEGSPSDRSGRVDPELHYELQQACKAAEAIGVSMSMVERSVPFAGKFATRLRRELHSLVLYYVNMLAGRQMVFNRAVAQVLVGLVTDFDQAEMRAEALEAEVTALKQRIEALTEGLTTRQ